MNEEEVNRQIEQFKKDCTLPIPRELIRQGELIPWGWGIAWIDYRTE